jgi:hypothetical protein
VANYRIAQDAGSIGDADDCWSVYKKTEDIEEVIAIVQTETLAEKLIEAIGGSLPSKKLVNWPRRPFILWLYGKHVCNCKWEYVARGTREELEKIMVQHDSEYVSFQTADRELDI